MGAVKNIIFDLGGVLLNIDYNKTTSAFKELGIQNFDELFSQFKANELFEKLETGHISEEDFYQSIQQYAAKHLEVDQIKTAWNAMLLDFRLPSLSFLEDLKKSYNIFLLSNTNSIHHKAFEKILLAETGKQTLGHYFIKSYYSHLVGMRKPYPETYLFVLNDAGIKTDETLFIDDSINNIETAIELGINCHHLLPAEKIENLGL